MLFTIAAEITLPLLRPMNTSASCSASSSVKAAFGKKLLLHIVQVSTAFVDQSLSEHHNVGRICTKSNVQFGTCHGRCAGTIYLNLAFSIFSSAAVPAFSNAAALIASCTMLVIVHYRNLHFLFQLALNMETLRLL